MNKQERQGFTLLELLMVVAVFAILLSLLLPNLLKARRAAESAVCLSNESTIMRAAGLYLKDNNSRYPYSVPSSNFEDCSVTAQCSVPWIGNLASQGHHRSLDVTHRSFNYYLGYNTSGQRTPITECNADKYGSYNEKGSSYLRNGNVVRLFTPEIETPDKFIVYSERRAQYIITHRRWAANDPEN